MAYWAVAVGGCLGALARYLLSEWLGTWNGFPIATWLINLAGSFFLTWFYTLTQDRIPIHPHLRLGIGTGFVGAFTTFSTYTVDWWKLVQAHLWTYAALYAAASLVGCLLAAAGGLMLASWQTRLRFQSRADVAD
ncbi:MAG: fluoride efflux transporter CrcB [Thermoflavifilum sp.]|nr:fluoride efflux transporter CrcB [Thermoflavifilum sp.]MCL6512908.1 fluoride efflux transporter CrcB [Alicyclobacillus sp.]